jgi:hypothetical protein
MGTIHSKFSLLPHDTSIIYFFKDSGVFFLVQDKVEFNAYVLWKHLGAFLCALKKLWIWKIMDLRQWSILYEEPHE